MQKTLHDRLSCLLCPMLGRLASSNPQGICKCNIVSAHRRCVPIRVELCEARANTHRRPELKMWPPGGFLEMTPHLEGACNDPHNDCLMTDDLTALLFEHGPATMASALATLMNHAMPIEHDEVLMPVSHQRSADRRGYANGFKPTTLNTLFGRTDLRITQTRDYRGVNGRPSYPRSLEQGVRSERAMTVAVAEKYVQGVSVREFKAVGHELSRLDITFTQVTRTEVAGDIRRVVDQHAEAERRLRTTTASSGSTRRSSDGHASPRFSQTKHRSRGWSLQSSRRSVTIGKPHGPPWL